MRHIKAFGEWYVIQITPFAIRIRPFLRKASFIITLPLCFISALWPISYLLSFNAYIVTTLSYTLIALLICSALIFLLYMITLQFDLDVPLAKHWLSAIPSIIFITIFIGYCVVEFIYGRNAPEWEEFHAIAVSAFIGWLFSVGLSAIHAQLLKHHRDNVSRYN